MRRPILIDGRNIYEAAEMNRLGLIYRGMGRGAGQAPSVLPLLKYKRNLVLFLKAEQLVFRRYYVQSYCHCKWGT